MTLWRTARRLRHLHNVYWDGKKWWLQRGRMLRDALSHHSPSIFLSLYHFCWSSLLTLLPLSMKTHEAAVSDCVQGFVVQAGHATRACQLYTFKKIYSTIPVIKAWIISSCIFIPKSNSKNFDSGPGWQNAWICWTPRLTNVLLNFF